MSWKVESKYPGALCNYSPMLLCEMEIDLFEIFNSGKLDGLKND